MLTEIGEGLATLAFAVVTYASTLIIEMFYITIPTVNFLELIYFVSTRTDEFFVQIITEIINT